MKLICIYGPPASGKLTIARELSALTGIKVFHNHIALDVATQFFEFRTPAMLHAAVGIIMAVLEAAAQSGLSLIFTEVYRPSDAEHEYLRRMIDIVERHGGEVCFVRLACTSDALEERVVADDRKQFGKIHDVETLRGFLSSVDPFATNPFGESLEVDTCALTPSQAARAIADRYGLQLIAEG